MSYVRFGEDSDIYMYESEAGIICQWCALVRETSLIGTHETAVRHLDLHRQRGDLVPDRAYENLREEASGKDFENPYDEKILDEVERELGDTELIKTFQYYWEPQPDWAFTRGFLPDYPLCRMDGKMTEASFHVLLFSDYEGEMTDFFIEF